VRPDNIFDYENLYVKKDLKIIAQWFISMMVVLKMPILFIDLRDWIIRLLQDITCFQNSSDRNWVHRLLLNLIIALSAYAFSWVVDLSLAISVSGSLFMAPTVSVLPALYMMKEVNLLGTVDGRSDSIYWNPKFTSNSKMIYGLAILLITAGLFSFVIGVFDVILNRL